MRRAVSSIYTLLHMFGRPFQTQIDTSIGPTRYCRQCHLYKPENQFYNLRNPGKFVQKCLDCRQQRTTPTAPTTPAPPTSVTAPVLAPPVVTASVLAAATTTTPDVPQAGLRKCVGPCGRVLPLDQFVNRKDPNKLTAHCSDCRDSRAECHSTVQRTLQGIRSIQGSVRNTFKRTPREAKLSSPERPERPLPPTSYSTVQSIPSTRPTAVSLFPPGGQARTVSGPLLQPPRGALPPTAAEHAAMREMRTTLPFRPSPAVPLPLGPAAENLTYRAAGPRRQG